MEPQQNEFSRGWTVLLACFIGIGVSLVSLVYYSGGIWVKPWQEAFGWSRAEIGLGQGLGTLAIVLGAPFAGWLIDRFGLKRTATLSLLLYGVCLFIFSKMEGSLWSFYLLSILVAFVALPSTPLGFTRAVNAWFEKNKGLALGISLTSTGLGAFFIPKYLTPYVAEQGWQAGYTILSLIVLIATPFVWFLLKEQPPSSQLGKSANGAIVKSGFTLKTAAKTPTFWKVGVVFFLISVAVIGLIPSFIPLLQDAGLTAAQAGGYAAILGLSVMLGRLATGFLIDRYFAPYVIALVFAFVASGCLALAFGGIQFALWAAIALGLAIGAEVDLIGYFTARYFGLKNYGSIYGAMYSIFSFGAIISPGIAGFIWDKTGNYNLALVIGAILVLVAVIVGLFLPKFPDFTEE
ncbi:MAG: MFS transporter [Saprospiraceae bacterium]|nr:MFS transporter [Saprospiraceae bacterium]